MEAYISVPGGHLLDAVTKANEVFGDESVVREETQAAAPAQNAQSMDMLQSMLAGVQGAPTKKPRRA